MSRPTKRYQVWALIRNEQGTEVWHAITEKYLIRKNAEKIADALWLETKIDVSEEDPYE